MAEKKNAGDEPVAFAQAEVDAGDQNATKGPTADAAGDAAGYPPGTHPLAPLEKQTHYAGNLKYEDNPDKPHESTVAQVQIREEWQPGVAPGEADE